MAGDESKWAPKSAESADHSLPFVVAVALAEGRIDIKSFDLAHLGDPKLAKLIKVIKVKSDTDITARFPESAGARVTVTDSAGNHFVEEVRSSIGHSDNPMDGATLLGKFRKLTDGRGDEQHIVSFLDDMNKLEYISDIRPVIGRLSQAEDSSPAL